MKCRIIVPARFASTRLPQKLVLKDTGKALICHTVDAAVKVCRAEPELFSGVAVATDDEMILEIVNSYASENNLPVEAVMTRVDHQSGSDRIAEAVSNINDESEVVINIQGDEPEIEPELVINLAKFMAENQSVEMATLAYPISGEAVLNPNLVKVVIGADGRGLYFSRSPVPYDRAANSHCDNAYGHVGIYAYRQNALMRFVGFPKGALEPLESLEQLRALEHGMDIYVIKLTHRPAKGIDTPEDYQEFAARYNGNK